MSAHYNLTVDISRNYGVQRIKKDVTTRINKSIRLPHEVDGRLQNQVRSFEVQEKRNLSCEQSKCKKVSEARNNQFHREQACKEMLGQPPTTSHRLYPAKYHAETLFVDSSAYP